jgi:hypothetical protein
MISSLYLNDLEDYREYLWHSYCNYNIIAITVCLQEMEITKIACGVVVSHMLFTIMKCLMS